MEQLLADPATWLLAAFAVVVATVMGRLRHESWLTVAMTAIGFNAFVLGMRWAGIIGGEAATAAFLATGGMALWGEAVRMGDRRSAAVRS
ncbi:MAG TPA: hypothetical protein VFN76_10545 [Candidatus Limnocylindria bacterium]|nr:hypothetical protein [Candidatus Limnocylindria bacterium]